MGFARDFFHPGSTARAPSRACASSSVIVHRICLSLESSET
jgi:hypothetical protein